MIIFILGLETFVDNFGALKPRTYELIETRKLLKFFFEPIVNKYVEQAGKRKSANATLQKPRINDIMSNKLVNSIVLNFTERLINRDFSGLH